jgi:hypothetical protein
VISISKGSSPSVCAIPIGRAPRGVQSSHPFQVSCEVALDHEVCNDLLVKQRRTWGK